MRRVLSKNVRAPVVSGAAIYLFVGLQTVPCSGRKECPQCGREILTVNNFALCAVAFHRGGSPL